MYEVKQPVEQLDGLNSKVSLHPEAIEILFENRRLIKKIFSNLQGLYGITHMGMACVDPSHELIAFSTTPNIEYNLIHQNLWVNDHCFTPDHTQKNALLWWDYQNEKIEKIKLKNNRFTLGMTIFRPVNDFFFIYSFATNEKTKDLRQFYNDNLFGLMDMGDYFYKSLRELYSCYATKHVAPQMKDFNSKASALSIKPFLRLIEA